MKPKHGTLLATISRHGLSLRCKSCGNGSSKKVSDLIEAFGRGASVGDVLSRLKCSHCTSREEPEALITYSDNSDMALLGARTAAGSKQENSEGG